MVTLACVATVCTSGLVALRWVLESRRVPPPDVELRQRLEALEAWKSRAEMGKLR